MHKALYSYPLNTDFVETERMFLGSVKNGNLFKIRLVQGEIKLNTYSF